MTKRTIKQWVLPIAALAGLSAGGTAAIAATQHPAQNNAPAKPVPVTASKTAAEAPGTEQSPASEAAGTAEAPGTEQSPASEQSSTGDKPDGGAEQPESAEQPGTESAANDDGPGGHADEPGNAAADHQFEGQE